ncbi:MAG: cation transporter, partial [Flavobacteriaceae bacterium]|nr:cation transporter [Flavobacteriaceae bacterium]
MKKIILSVALLTILGLISCKEQTEKNKETKQEIKTEVAKEIAMTDLSFGVRGNCGMCKATIEKAVNAVEGIVNAKWDVDKKKLDVSFDDVK